MCVCVLVEKKTDAIQCCIKYLDTIFDEFKLITQKRECVQFPFNDSSNLNKMSFNRGIMGIPNRFPFVNYIQQRN